jgi:hypothetical protein
VFRGAPTAHADDRPGVELHPPADSSAIGLLTERVRFERQRGPRGDRESLDELLPEFYRLVDLFVGRGAIPSRQRLGDGLGFCHC